MELRLLFPTLWVLQCSLSLQNLLEGFRIIGNAPAMLLSVWRIVQLAEDPVCAATRSHLDLIGLLITIHTTPHTRQSVHYCSYYIVISVYNHDMLRTFLIWRVRFFH